MWRASILPILGFLGLSILELSQGTRQTDRRTDRHRPSFHNAASLWRSGHNNAPEQLYCTDFSLSFWFLIVCVTPYTLVFELMGTGIEPLFAQPPLNEWVSVQSLTSHSAHNRSFRGRVFPGNRLRWYWQQNTNQTIHHKTQITNHSVTNKLILVKKTHKTKLPPNS